MIPTRSPSAAVSSPTGSPCPAAGLEGFLVAQNGELVVVADAGQAANRVMWQPWEYRVRAEGQELVVEDVSGNVIAREGDFVRLGGGETTTPGVFTVCGPFEVDER